MEYWEPKDIAEWKRPICDWRGRCRRKKDFCAQTIVKTINLKRIGAPFWQLIDVDDSGYVQEKAAFHPSCRFGESQNGSHFTSPSQSKTAFITSSIMSLLHVALGGTSNDTTAMTVRLCHGSNLLKVKLRKLANKYGATGNVILEMYTSTVWNILSYVWVRPRRQETEFLSHRE